MNRKRSYIAHCIEKSIRQRDKMRCILGHLYRAWNDPKYDMDILLFLLHLIWSIVVVFGNTYPGAFYNATPSIEEAFAYTYFWSFSAGFLAVLHYLNIFVRKPIMRLPVFFLSTLWGLGVSWTIFGVDGWSMASFIYAVIFVYMPCRKIMFIIREAVLDYQMEKDTI